MTLEAIARDDWRFIWCHERCHKPENDVRRQAMTDVAAKRGGSAMCFKKAKQLGRWIANGERPKFVLVTDWREAQPTATELAQTGGVDHMTLMVVLCEGHAQLKKAAAWARLADLHKSIIERLQLVDVEAIPKDLFDGLIHRCFSSAAASGEDSDSASDTAPGPSSSEPSLSGASTAESCWASEASSISTSPMLVASCLLPARPPPGLFLSEATAIPMSPMSIASHLLSSRPPPGLALSQVGTPPGLTKRSRPASSTSTSASGGSPTPTVSDLPSVYA
mmetsp:Transcript_47807/g.137682  ORF Transcript_47807/g.137682 Transcript_47807/m.137682 type:complete len:278 (-) Transcript_47807:109-942(-)